MTRVEPFCEERDSSRVIDSSHAITADVRGRVSVVAGNKFAGTLRHCDEIHENQVVRSKPAVMQRYRGELVSGTNLSCGCFRTVVLNLWGIPHWWGWRSCQVGNDRSDSRTTASKYNKSHPNVDLLYKSQLFTEEMESWPTKKWGIGEKRLRTPALDKNFRSYVLLS